MDQIKHLLKNYERYEKGEIVHQDISSSVVQEIMYSFSVCCTTSSGKFRYSCLILGFMSYFYFYSNLFIGFPTQLSDLPNLSKYINMVAGVTISAGKWVFVCWKHDELTQLVQMMNAESQTLRIRGLEDKEVQKLRNTFYFNEMRVFLGSLLFNAIFIVSIFLQCVIEQEMLFDVNSPVEIPLISDNYPVALLFQFCDAVYVSVLLNCSAILIGNLYNQIILHLEVLHHDFYLLDAMHFETPEEFYVAFCKLIAKYQSIAEMCKRCNACMGELFISDTMASMVSGVFSCVELGIAANQDVRACFRPAFYCLFIYTLLFYYCWLGTHLADRSTKLATSGFIYKERSSTVRMQKLQLHFIRMVQAPLTIRARPFFVLNYSLFVLIVRLSYQFTAVFRTVSAK